MVTLFLSGNQIQKVRDKTVKESILAEMQSRYSRNLWSSSFAGVMYNTMDVKLQKWGNTIDFTYNAGEATGVENTFVDNFEIKYITNYNNGVIGGDSIENITLHYVPYQISCNISDWDKSYDNIVVLTRVNNSQDYCFEIKPNNCKLLEVSETLCNYFIKNN